MKIIGLWSLFLIGLCAEEMLQEKLDKALPLLGHRNWIVIADAAYPHQMTPGVETIAVPGEMLDVVQKVIKAVNRSKHLHPVFYTDLEMKFVSEKNAPGIGAYRQGLMKMVEGKNVHELPHEELIGKLDEAGKTFKILLIKTPMDKPYTSLFIQLECGYWNAASEKELREAMQGKK